MQAQEALGQITDLQNTLILTRRRGRGGTGALLPTPVTRSNSVIANATYRARSGQKTTPPAQQQQIILALDARSN